jgi:hypothetical protein
MQSHHCRHGRTTLLAHTLVAENKDEIKTVARPAKAKYLKVNIEMQRDHYH